MSRALNLLMHISVVSSLLILLIFILRFVFKDKINAKLQYALWIIVAVRLLIPFDFQWTLETKDTLPQTHILESISENKADLREKNEKEFEVTNNETNKDIYHSSINNTATESTTHLSIISNILFITWIIGIVCMLVLFGIHNVSFHKRVKRTLMSYKISDNSYNKAAKMIGLKHTIPVCFSPSLNSPCIIGIFHPVIVLTESIIYDVEKTKLALLHEMVHYKQKDNFFRLLGYILCAFYWFNPLVWLAAETARNDAELSCDTRVVQKLNNSEHFNYCMMLLSINGNKNQIVAAMSTGGRKMKKRIDMILKPPQKQIITIVAATICLLMGIASFINISVKAENFSEPELNSKESTPNVISLGETHKVYQFLNSLENPNDNYKINTIVINNTHEDRNTDCIAKSIYLGYEFSKSDSVGGLSDDDVQRINVNVLHLFSSIPDLDAATISYIDKPANSSIRNKKAPITYRYKRSEIEDLNITPQIDNSFSQSLGGNNVIIVCGYSELFSSIGIEEKEYEENPEMVSKIFSKLGDYDKSWKSDGSTLYRFSPNPLYSDWSNLMIITDKFGNLEGHGAILSDLNGF